jgi:hypothetical protein
MLDRFERDRRASAGLIAEAKRVVEIRAVNVMYENGRCGSRPTAVQRVSKL